MYKRFTFDLFIMTIFRIKTDLVLTSFWRRIMLNTVFMNLVLNCELCERLEVMKKTIRAFFESIIMNQVHIYR